jgi:hypothetical protein
MRETARGGVEHERLSPFPDLPETVASRHTVGDLALRSFGLYDADLDVDFDRTPRPVLVTHLLERCTQSVQKGGVEQSLFWNLPVGKRIECLLTLLMCGTESEITLGFRCPNATCGEESEIAISIEEVAALQAEAYSADRVAVPVGNEILALRRPTGSDQLGWLKSTFANAGAVRRAMVRTLLVNDDELADGRRDMPREEWLDSIDEAMEEHDPLINFKLKVKCPSCENTSLVAIDLEELSLRGLRNAQLRLLASVHRLAAHYHWSEQQIFAVPSWRRAQYLSLIANERTQ